MSWWTRGVRGARAQVPAPMSPRPDAMEFDVKATHYQIVLEGGQEYTVWADSIVHGTDMTRFQETLSYRWVPKPGFNYTPTSGDWVASGSYRSVLEVRTDRILSMQYLGEKIRKLVCE